MLIEGAPRILTAYPETLSERARDQLLRLGVEVRTSCMLEEIVPGRGVRVRNARIRTGSAAPGSAAPDGAAPDSGGPASEWIATRNVLWAAGVAASPLARSLGSPLDRAGRVLVRPDLTVPGHPEIQVIGDLAAFVHQTGEALPGVAPVAIQQGRAAARNVLRSLRGQPSIPFRYRDKGSLATIGRSAAVADFGWLRLSGFLAWAAWCVVHIFFLIGFRNRLIVMFEWAWAYVTRQRGVRLITGCWEKTERGRPDAP
jgi:NADH dehydrogenase